MGRASRCAVVGMTFLTRIKGWAVAIAAALAILTGAYLKGRSDSHP